MKRIEQKILYFTEGSSDKVYEVDLCEISPDKYMVNFRFGRRGTTLKDSTKTISPVQLNEAREIFNDLINSKIKKGYSEKASNNTERQNTNKTELKNDNNDSRIQTILKYLESGKFDKNTSETIKSSLFSKITNFSGKNKKSGNKEWSFSRVIWRVGELRIKEATPILIDLLPKATTDLDKYCIISSIGLCGDKNCLSLLDNIYNNDYSSDMIKRISFEAILKINNGVLSPQIKEKLLQSLPSQLKEIDNFPDYDTFSVALQNYLSTNKNFSVLDTIYQLNSENIRPALINILKTATLNPAYTKYFRHIFKASEYRRDAEIFGIIAYRFEKEISMYQNRGYFSGWSFQNVAKHFTEKDLKELGFKEVYAYGKTVSLKKSDIKKSVIEDKGIFGYSSKTRHYLRTRVCRTLNKLAEINDPDFVKMAVGVLLPYSDKDANEIKQETKYFYNYKTRKSTTLNLSWDRFAPYLPLNFLLYKNSERYMLKEHNSAWVCKPPYKPGDPNPEKREEAFPELWNKNPGGLVHLLVESECEVIHQFAAKAMFENKNIWTDIDSETIIFLLQKPYTETAKLALEVAIVNYAHSNPDIEIIEAMLGCSYPKAREQGRKWIDEQKRYFIDNSDLIIKLLISEYSDNRVFAGNLLNNSILAENTSKTLIARIVSYLLSLDVSGSDKAKDISKILFKNFVVQLRNIGLDVINDLLNHPLEEIQELGGQILLNHQIEASKLPEVLFETLINSEFISVRGIGIRLIGSLPDEILIDRINLITSLITHKLTDLRDSSKVVVLRLKSVSNYFALNLTNSLLEKLSHREKIEGIYSDTITLLENNFSEYLKNVSLEQTLKIVYSKSLIAQDFAGKILLKNTEWSNNMNILEIVKMTNQESFSVRQAGWKFISNIIEKIRSNPGEMAKLIRFFDSKWKDSREYAQNELSKYLIENDWTPEFLIGLCDSIYTDVRNFAREKIMNYFKSENGEEYLVKLSEHPSTDMQIFATNYLESYAADDFEKIITLIPYFKRILANVNRSRIAKDRILLFLNKEAKKDGRSAEVISEIISWYSATIAIGDKAKSIETMVALNHQYPQMESILKIKPVEVKDGI